MENISPPNLVLGRHALIDLSGCNPDTLTDYAYIRKTLTQAARLAKVTVVGMVDRHFKPQGYTAILVLEESHLSIHTWPEYNYVSLDLYSCNLETDFQAVQAFLAKRFQADRSEFTLLERGCSRATIAPMASMPSGIAYPLS
jgi:S-adenosylmethionine decarboxylase proenzyme